MVSDFTFDDFEVFSTVHSLKFDKLKNVTVTFAKCRSESFA